MSNDKQQPMSIDFLLDEFIKNGVYLSPHFLQKFREAKKMHQEERDQSYRDGFEFALINECAKKSTLNASSYSDGYNNGWEDCKTEINKKAIQFINSVKQHNNEQQ